MRDAEISPAMTQGMPRNLTDRCIYRRVACCHYPSVHPCRCNYERYNSLTFTTPQPLRDRTSGLQTTLRRYSKQSVLVPPNPAAVRDQ
jgi:hypothetical protein